MPKIRIGCPAYVSDGLLELRMFGGRVDVLKYGEENSRCLIRIFRPIPAVAKAVLTFHQTCHSELCHDATVSLIAQETDGACACHPERSEGSRSCNGSRP